MSHYGILLILLPISMTGVLAMPDHHRKLTSHRRHEHHRHSHDNPDHPSVHHHIRHLRHRPTLKDLEVLELDVSSLEESHDKYTSKTNTKRDNNHIDNFPPYSQDESGFRGYYEPKCNYTVEPVLCKGNDCAQRYLRHIKCKKPGALTPQDNGEYCVQTYTTVHLNCTGASAKPMKLFTGCVFVTEKQLERKDVDRSL